MVTIVLIISLLMSVPVGMALAVTTMIGMFFLPNDILIMMPQKFLSGLDSFPLIAIPLFVLAGQLMSHGGLAKRIVDLAMVFVGRIYGGLGLVVISSTMLMSGISGSPSANTAAIGSVAIPAMRRMKYPPARSLKIHCFITLWNGKMSNTLSGRKRRTVSGRVLRIVWAYNTIAK